MSSFGGLLNQQSMVDDLNSIDNNIESKLAGSLIPYAFDQVTVAYNPDNTVDTAVYFLNGVQIATATCTYAAGLLIDVSVTTP